MAEAISVISLKSMRILKLSTTLGGRKRNNGSVYIRRIGNSVLSTLHLLTLSIGIHVICHSWFEYIPKVLTVNSETVS